MSKGITRIWIFTLCMLASTFCQQHSVLMHVLFQDSVAFVISVSFSRELYEQFHRCLCNETTKACTARFVSFGANPRVGSIATTPKRQGDPELSNLYSCTIPIGNERLACTKLQLSLTSSKPIVNCTSYRIPKINSCSFGCVTIVWSNTAEGLFDIGGGFLEFNQCQSLCSGNSSVATIATRETATTATTTADEDDTSTRQGSTSSSDPNTSVIVAIVVSISLVAVVGAVVGVLLWKRRKCSNIPDKDLSITGDGVSTDRALGIRSNNDYYNEISGLSVSQNVRIDTVTHAAELAADHSTAHYYSEIDDRNNTAYENDPNVHSSSNYETFTSSAEDEINKDQNQKTNLKNKEHQILSDQYPEDASSLRPEYENQISH